MLNSFTIIIPTRDRLETLKGTLRCLLSQNYPKLSIIISDNSTNEQTNIYFQQELILYPFIKYYSTGGGLSMTENWNFGLEKVTELESFVSIIGDDDGLSLNCLADLNRIINKTNLDSYVCAWAYYKWPNLEKMAGELSFTGDKGYEIRDSKKDLIQTLLSRRNYTEIPHIYTGGFIRFSKILPLKKNAVFLESISPDTYSSVLLSLNTERYVFIKDNLALCGTSAKSNSAAVCGLVASKENLLAFWNQNTYKTNEFFIDDDLRNITFAVLDSYITYRGYGDFIVPPRKILINALTRGIYDYKNTILLVKKLLEKNGYSKISSLEYLYIYSQLSKMSFKKILRFIRIYRADTGKENIKDIIEASIFMKGFLISKDYKMNVIFMKLYKRLTQ